LIGSGLRSANAIEKLEAFIEKTRIPLTFAHSAVDAYGTDNELSIGAVGGMHGTRAGNFTVQNCDLLLVLGCRLTSMTTGPRSDQFVRAGKIVAVDINPGEFGKNTAHIDKIVPGDVRDVLTKLIKSDTGVANAEWQEKCKHWKSLFSRCEDWARAGREIDLYALAKGLSETLPEKSLFVVDAGLEELILPSHIAFRRGMRCIQPNMQGAMGFALPAAIGAYYASYASGNPVCAVIGDGSVMMNLQELATVQYRQIPLKLFVVENDMYAVIRKRQRELFRTRTIGTDPKNGVGSPNFAKIADCFGLKYRAIDDSEGLESALADVFATDGAVLCEIRGKPDQVYLCDAYARTADKRFVHRPIEDLAPFLDEDLFLSEMIIEPAGR
jgi:acetolactate synthase-1/2/3 large subunit